MIENRQQFDRSLAEAIALSERYKQDDGIAAVLKQLVAIREWTADGGNLTRNQADGLTIGRIVMMLFDHLRPTVKKVDEWCDLVLSVWSYATETADDD